MSTQRAVLALCLMYALPPATALAASATDEVAALRQELEQTKALVQQLESRLEAVEAVEAEAKAPAGPLRQTEAVAATETSGAASSPSLTGDS